MKLAEDIKKWKCLEIYNNTDDVYKKFNEIYQKDRVAARYYIQNNRIVSEVLKVFYKDNINILILENVYYGVSITFKRYKSIKTINKYYIDLKKGSITKYKNGKFLPCKASDIDAKSKDYITSKLKWTNFIFELNLPVTFTTVVTKKLYSRRKLLNWFWGTNYNVSSKLEILRIKGDFSNETPLIIRKNLKNIKNINNINIEFIETKKYYRLFLQTLILAVKSSKTINAKWSFNRLLNEYNKMNREVLDRLYETYNEPIIIHDIFKPLIPFIKSNGYIIPSNYKELSKFSNREDIINNVIADYKKNKSIIVIKDNIIKIISYNKYNKYNNNISNKTLSDRFYTYCDNIAIISKEEYENSNIYFSSIANSDDIISLINQRYDELLKQYKRMLKINIIQEQNKNLEISN